MTKLNRSHLLGDSTLLQPPKKKLKPSPTQPKSAASLAQFLEYGSFASFAPTHDSQSLSQHKASESCLLHADDSVDTLDTSTDDFLSPHAILALFEGIGVVEEEELATWTTSACLERTSVLLETLEKFKTTKPTFFHRTLYLSILKILAHLSSSTVPSGSYRLAAMDLARDMGGWRGTLPMENSGEHQPSTSNAPTHSSMPPSAPTATTPWDPRYMVYGNQLKQQRK